MATIGGNMQLPFSCHFWAKYKSCGGGHVPRVASAFFQCLVVRSAGCARMQKYPEELRRRNVKHFITLGVEFVV
jgi:hypothetical protein